MAKIHTHYDNLKVSRGAPQEVVRAAYKALSQKYHPDKNPGDEKAARIMAILNSAYETLSDPVRRKEHDDWIAAEEWEVAWLESTHQDSEHHEKPRNEAQAWATEPVARPRRYRPWKDARWWGGMGAMLALGCLIGVAATGPWRVLPAAVASAVGTQPEPPRSVQAAHAVTRPDPADPLNEPADAWASVLPSEPAARTDIHSLAVAQLAIPARAPDCDQELHTLAAPNGEPWPAQSGYVDGYPLANQGGEMQVTVDNGANSSPVFVKVFDLEHGRNVRHAYIKPHETLTIDQLAVGKYEVRYQNIEVGATLAECVGRRKQQAALRQADAASAMNPAPGATEAR